MPAAHAEPWQGVQVLSCVSVGSSRSAGCLSLCPLHLPTRIAPALQGDQEVAKGMVAETEGREMPGGTANGRSCLPMSAAET